MPYSFDHFAKEIKKQPGSFPAVMQWLEYLSSSFCQRQAKGKTELEFANIVLLAKERDLPKNMLEFLVKNIYLHLRDDRQAVIEAILPQLSKTDIAGSLKLLRKILSTPIAIQETARKGSLFSWFKKTPQPQTSPKSDETIVSSLPKTSLAPNALWDETLVSSQQPTATPPKPKPGPLDAMFEDALESVPMETLMVSGRSMSIIERFTSRWSSAKVETILSTGSPFQDAELESLRMQTLVTLNRPGSVLAWTSFPKEQELYTSKHEIFIKLVQGMSTRSDLNPKVRALLTNLKNSINIRAKLLTEPGILCNIIKQGMHSFQHTLDRLTELTDNKKINQKIWEYLHWITHNELMKQSDVFRKKLLDCQTCEDLDKILEQFSVSASILKKYPNLGIIQSIHQIKTTYSKYPSSLIKILNKYLGVHGEVNIKEKMSKLLLTSEAEAKIFQELSGSKSLGQLQERLGKLQSKPDLIGIVEKLGTLLDTFLDINNHFSFSQFITSLNTFAPVIRHKVVALVRPEIQKEIKDKFASIIASPESAADKLFALTKVLENPRYHDNFIQMYGYEVKVLLEKVQSIKPGNEPNLSHLVRHIISNPQAPDTFIEIIAEGKHTTKSSLRR